MTPDGNPILGEVEGVEGFLLATGACGQGFMLGPGVGQLLTHLIQEPYLSKNSSAFIVCA